MTPPESRDNEGITCTDDLSLFQTGMENMAVPATPVQHISQILSRDHAFICGDAWDILPQLPDEYFQCCVTSPPYWSTRYRGRADRLGCELDHKEYLGKLVELFHEVRRTLTPTGTFWLIIGDTFASEDPESWEIYKEFMQNMNNIPIDFPTGFKQKDLMGIPWRLAMALQEDGWYLRSEIIWSIPNYPKERVRDRPPRSHEYVFLFTKSEQYEFNHSKVVSQRTPTVWEIPTVTNSPIGYAVFPEPLAERCLVTGSRKGDVILDPFSGSGTVSMVAKKLNRRSVGIELDPEYVAISEKRIHGEGSRGG